MTKKQLLATLAVSTVALAQAGLASADEVTTVSESLNDVTVVTDTQPVDPSTPVIPDVPTDPSTPPTTPDVPVDPETPPTNPDGGDTTPDQPTDPSTPPTDGDTDNSGGDNNPGTGEDTDKPSEPGTGEDTNKPVEPEQPTDPNPPITDDAVNKDEQGNITVKPQPVAPDQTVIGTQNGQLLVQDASGNTRFADATEFGGQKNENGTVSFKTADGKMVTLPETGSTSGALLSLLGSGLLGLAGFFWKKKQSLL